MKLLKWSFKVRIGVWQQRCNYLALEREREREREREFRFTFQSQNAFSPLPNSTLCTIWPQHTPQRRPRTMQAAAAVSPVCLRWFFFHLLTVLVCASPTAYGRTAIQTAIHLTKRHHRQQSDRKDWAGISQTLIILF